MPLDFTTKEGIKEVLNPEDGEVDPAYVKQLEDTVKQLQDQGRQAQLQKTMSGAKLDQARAEETMAKVNAVDADVAKTRAETTEKLESARNKALENDIIRTKGYTEAKVNI
jgi:MFS superfamily sulfate permease-like transporter